MPKRNFTSEIELQIVDRYLSGGETFASLGIIYGCSTNCIRKICVRNNGLKPRIQCDENYFENIDTPDKAYFLGFIMADAHISKNNHIISLTLKNTDVEILQKFSKYLKSEYKISFRDKYDSRTNKTYNSCTTSISKAKLVEDLAKLGVTTNKSTELDLPKISDDLNEFMIRGLVDGDGGFYIDRLNNVVFKLVSSTYSLLEQVQEILVEKCSLNKTNISFDTGCFRLRYNGNGSVRKIYNYLYNDLQTDLYLTRKFNYIKCHFDNLDKGIVTRQQDDTSISQYTNMKTDAKEKPVKITKPVQETNLLKLLLRNPTC